MTAPLPQSMAPQRFGARTDSDFEMPLLQINLRILQISAAQNTELGIASVRSASRQRPGVLQSSGAFRSPVVTRKSPSTGALQNAIATFLALALLLPSCSSDTVRCRKVSAAEFMRPHTFKGIASDAFIGTADEKTFKKVFHFGLVNSWEVLWIPSRELPSDYLLKAAQSEKGFRSGHHARHTNAHP
jgi:hypothetical protein